MKLSEEKKKAGWQIVRFGEVAKEVKATTSDPAADGLEFYVGLEHLDPQSLRIQRKGLIAEDNPTFTRTFKPGQILFGKRRAYQKKAAVADFEGICSGDILVMEAKPGKILPGLLPFIVQSDLFFDHAVKTSSGSLSPRTKWKSLADFEFPLPPPARQKAILEVLENNEECSQSIHEFELSTELLLRQLLLSFFPNFFEKNLTNLKRMPKGWTRLDLGKLLSANPESGFSANEIHGESKWNVLNLNCLSRSGFVNNGYKPVSEEDFNSGSRLKQGDFLISRSNTKDLVGVVGIYKENEKLAIFPDTMWRLHLNKNQVLPEYFVT